MKEVVSRRQFHRHLPWIGFLVVLLGAVSYFMVFAKYPATRDVPWVNLPLVILGVVVTMLGARRRAGLGKVIAVTLSVLSVVVASAFFAYVFYISYQMPSPTATATELEQTPDFTLPDQNGKPVSLNDYTGRRLVIAFFRGYW